VWFCTTKLCSLIASAIESYFLHNEVVQCLRNRESRIISAHRVCGSVQRSLYNEVVQCLRNRESRIISAHRVCGSVQRSCAVDSSFCIRSMFRTTECVVLLALYAVLVRVKFSYLYIFLLQSEPFHLYQQLLQQFFFCWCR